MCIEDGIGPYKICELLTGEFFDSWDDSYEFLENSDYNWYQIALAVAEKNLQENPNQTTSSVIGSLIGQGFTDAQAKYAQANMSTSTGDPAMNEVLSILEENLGRSPGVVAGLLIMRGFTEDEALTAVANCEADWNEQAVLALQRETAYYDEAGYSYTRDDLYAYLTDGSQQNFTHMQAEYALSELGY